MAGLGGGARRVPRGWERAGRGRRARHALHDAGGARATRPPPPRRSTRGRRSASRRPESADVTGYVKRSDGRNTVWIDGRPVVAGHGQCRALRNPRRRAMVRAYSEEAPRQVEGKSARAESSEVRRIGRRDFWRAPRAAVRQARHGRHPREASWQRGTLLIAAPRSCSRCSSCCARCRAARYRARGRAPDQGNASAISERSLAQAREALIAYAVDRPINAIVGPGYLPCPDLDDDGWAESTCGSHDRRQRAGAASRAACRGRRSAFPDLRDGYGERLWYAVSSKYKGLLNCGVSRACVDMSPGHQRSGPSPCATPRDSWSTTAPSPTTIAPTRAGRSRSCSRPGRRSLAPTAGGAAARLRAVRLRRERALPRRSSIALAALRSAQLPRPSPRTRVSPTRTTPTSSIATTPPGARATRTDSSAGPVLLPDGRLAVNDRLTAVAYRDVMPRLMERVALEVAACLRYYASRPENAGRYPWPAPACAHAASGAESAGLALRAGARHTVRRRAIVERRAHARALVAGRAALRRKPRGAADTRRRVPHRDRARRCRSGASRVSRHARGRSAHRRTRGNAWWSASKPFVFDARRRVRRSCAPDPGQQRTRPRSRLPTTRSALVAKASEARGLGRLRRRCRRRFACEDARDVRPRRRLGARAAPFNDAWTFRLRRSRGRFTLIEVAVVILVARDARERPRDARWPRSCSCAAPRKTRAPARRCEGIAPRLRGRQRAPAVPRDGRRAAARRASPPGGDGIERQLRRASMTATFPAPPSASRLSMRRDSCAIRGTRERSRIRYAVFGAGSRGERRRPIPSRALNGMQAATLAALGDAPHFLLICASGARHVRLGMRARGKPAHAAGGLRAAVARAQRGRGTRAPAATRRATIDGDPSSCTTSRRHARERTPSTTCPMGADPPSRDRMLAAGRLP